MASCRNVHSRRTQAVRKRYVRDNRAVEPAAATYAGMYLLGTKTAQQLAKLPVPLEQHILMEARGWVVSARVDRTAHVELVAIWISLRPHELSCFVGRNHKRRDIRAAPCPEGDVRTRRSGKHGEYC